MVYLGELQHEIRHDIRYTDFGDATMHVWYSEIPEVVQVMFFCPELGETYERPLADAKSLLDRRISEIASILKFY